MPKRHLLRFTLLALAFFLVAAQGACPGLDPIAFMELRAVGLDNYIGQFQPAYSEDAGNGWTRHVFDADEGDGPLCIDGSDFIVYTRPGSHPDQVAIFLDGGGACWQNFYFCSEQSDAEAPPDVGIFADGFDTGTEYIYNPLKKFSIVAASYCDGSVWIGDNAVDDPNYPSNPVRHHRGLRNLTAALDLAKDEFGIPDKLLIAGASAGGVGAAGLAPSLARLVWGNFPHLFVFNDAGPIASNVSTLPPVQAAIQARADDWDFERYYPPSCTECSAFNQGTEIVKWRLGRDTRLLEAFYSTDGDATNRFFLAIPNQSIYRFLITGVHGEVNAIFPETYKTFIRSGDDSHTALATPLFYTATANGVPLHQWTTDFIKAQPGWVNIVEDFVPVP